MKKILLITCVMFTIAHVFAQDEGKLKLKTGYEYMEVHGYYNHEGDTIYEDIPPVHSVLLEASFKVLDGLEPGVKLRYNIIDRDSGIVTGINRPIIELKYTSSIGLGGFIDMFLPLGSEDIVGEDPEIEFAFAVFFDNLFYCFTLYTEIFLDLQIEGDDNTAQNQLRCIIQPGIMILDNLEYYFGMQVYLGLGTTVNGDAVDDSGGYLLRFKAGIAYQVIDMLELEASVSGSPSFLEGKSSPNIGGFIAWMDTVFSLSATFSLF